MKKLATLIFVLLISIGTRAQQTQVEIEYNKIIKILSTSLKDADTLGRSQFFSIRVKAGKTPEISFSSNYYFADSIPLQKELRKINWSIFGKNNRSLYLIPVYYLKRSYDGTVEFDAKTGIMEGYPASDLYWSAQQPLCTLPCIFINKYNGPKKEPKLIDKSGIKSM